MTNTHRQANKIITVLDKSSLFTKQEDVEILNKRIIELEGLLAAASAVARGQADGPAAAACIAAAPVGADCEAKDTKQDSAMLGDSKAGDHFSLPHAIETPNSPPNPEATR